MRRVQAGTSRKSYPGKRGIAKRDSAGYPSRTVMPVPFQDHDTLLFIGDSITDCGRDRPVGEGPGLGSGYVSLVNAALGARVPEKHIRVLNTGVSGDRVVDLRARWQADALDHKPDWLSILVGINDVWRQFDHPEWAPRRQVTPGNFKKGLHELRASVVGKVKGVFLLSPFFLELNPGDRMRAVMDRYRGIVREVASDEGARFVDLQEAFDRYLAERLSQTIAADRVHPNLTGHQIIADAFLAAAQLPLA